MLRKALLLALLAVGCASEASISSPVGPGAAPALPVVALRWENQPDLPDETRPDGVPVSLTAGDGEGLAISALSAAAVIEDPLAFTEMRFVFKNPEPRTIEGRFEITLPPNATISRFAMRQSDGSWQEGEVVELQAAREAYEDALHRRVDPALLEKQAGNRFQARVFPIPASGEKEIIFSYSQELVQNGDPYRVYLRGLPQLGRLDIRVLHDKRDDPAAPGRRSFELSKTDFKPDHDFALPLPASGKEARGLRLERLAVGRITPLADTAPDPVKSLLVLFDTSASRALGFAAEVERLGRLVDALRKSAGPTMPLAVIAFDQTTQLIHDGPAGEFGQKQLDALLARKPLGASDLGKALRFASSFATRSPTQTRLARVLVLGDGIVTAGPSEAAELKAEVAKLHDAGVERVDAIVTGGIRDESLLRQLTVGGLARDGVVMDGARPPAAIAARLGQRALSKIEVRVPGSTWVWPTELHGMQPGDEALVYALLPEPMPFVVELGGAIKAAPITVATRAVERPMLERAMANAEIQRLMRDRSAAANEEAREQIKYRIIGLSTKYRVLSDFTALLILETDEDYARFKIDRRALTNILTVGSTGVEPLDRNKPVPPQQVAGDVAQVAAPDAPKEPGAPATEEKPSDRGGSEGKKDSSAGPRGGAAPPPPPMAAATAAATAAPQAPPRSPPSDQEADRRSVERPSPPQAKKQKSAQAPREQAEAPAGPPPPPQPASPARRAAGRPAKPSPSATGRRSDPLANDFESTMQRAASAPPEDPELQGAPPYEGKFRDVMALLERKQAKEALDLAMRWHESEPGDALALIALGEAYEALAQKTAAARAYGSLIDLFPGRADLRRFAGARLERLGQGPEGAFDLVVDTYRQAVAQRPDHPASHRLYAYALSRAGKPEEAFEAIVAGVQRDYPQGRFRGVEQILWEDVGLLAAAWIRARPEKRQAVLERLKVFGVTLPTKPSVRFVLIWETDANDVDFHIRDSKGGHAFYKAKKLPSGGRLYADVTTGYGPECFTIEGRPLAYPYRLQAQYYSRGPMGYGMGKLEILEHDGKGGLKFEERPYVVMTNHAFVDLGKVTGPLP